MVREEVVRETPNKVPFFTAGSRLDPRYPLDFFIRWIPPKSGRSLIFLKIEIPLDPAGSSGIYIRWLEAKISAGFFDDGSSKNAATTFKKVIADQTAATVKGYQM